MGDLDIDLAQARVTLRGQPVALERSGYDLLLHLVEHSGSVVGKDDLLRVGWPGRVVSENTLAKAISRLRQAIGDEEGELVRVVHGYGYRLVAEVAMHYAPAPASETAPTAAASPVEAPPRRTPWRPVAVATALLAIAAAAGWGWTTARLPASTAATLVTRPAPAGSDVIAVLPFRDLSKDGSLGMLADGFAHHIRDYMQGVPPLRIVNLADTLAWRGDRGDAAAAARGLGANLIVNGDLDWRDGRLLATVRLFDAHGRVQTVDHSFERPPAD